MAIELLAGCPTLRTRVFKLGLTLRQDCWLCGDKKECIAHIVSLSGIGLRKIQNLGSYVLDPQGSVKYEGEWPNKSGSHCQAWHGTLTPFYKIEETQWNCKNLRVIRDHNGTTRCFSTTVVTITILDWSFFFGFSRFDVLFRGNTNIQVSSHFILRLTFLFSHLYFFFILLYKNF